MTNDGRPMNDGFLRTFGFLAATVLATGCARHLPPAERVQTTNVVALRAAFGGGATETAATTTAPANPLRSTPRPPPAPRPPTSPAANPPSRLASPAPSTPGCPPA